MIKILFIVVILGCFIDNISSDNSTFEFHDSNGRCWNCQLGGECVRCQPTTNRYPRVFPDPWDRTCPTPPSATCTQWPTTKFPSRCRDHFYQCTADGQSTRIKCTGETFFDMRLQNCVPIGDVRTQACDNYFDVGAPCEGGVTSPPETTPNPGITTPTAGPTAGPTNGPVTNAPCVCVLWWPCPCNPCWNMPCHSCSGCVGMMG